MQNTQTIYEQIQKDKNSYAGITLSYNGAQFIPSSFHNNTYIGDNETLTPLQALTERFRNLGALVIRFHLGQGQRAGLLQQISKFNYSENPVERPAHGNDAVDLFFEEGELDESQAIGTMLEFSSHQPMGRSKVLNERAQPLIHINLKASYGEQGIWDIIHAPVWNVGRSLKYELTKQGFMYLSCPPDLSLQDRAALDKELRESGKPYHVVLEEMFVPVVESQISKLDIYMDDKKEFTKEENGLAISTNKEKKAYSALGWIIHKETGAILPQEVTEDIIRVSAIAEGGFYEKRPAQQRLLQSGNLKNSSGLGLFVQNQAFNAIYVILDYLQHYNFDPRPLLDNSLNVASKRLISTIESDPSIIDDFLVGAIQDEMVQALRVSQPKSKRSQLPVRFTNPFAVTLNSLKAIAYAFDLRDADAQPIFRAFDDTPVITSKESFIDSEVNGKLVTPSFNTGSHVAAVIATAELVAEQMILEQLLPEAYLNKENPNDTTLYKIITALCGKEEADQFWSVLMEETAKMPFENDKPVTGLQFDYCQTLVNMLRSKLELNSTMLLYKFSKPGVSTAEIMETLNQPEQRQLNTILRNLYVIGEKLQKSPLTSGQPELSRGINAGLNPLIAHLNPDLADALRIDTKSIIKAAIPAIKKELVRGRISTEAFERCPFLAGQRQQFAAQQKQQSLLERIWSNRATIAVVGVVGAAAVISGIALNT